MATNNPEHEAEWERLFEKFGGQRFRIDGMTPKKFDSFLRRHTPASHSFESVCIVEGVWILGYAPEEVSGQPRKRGWSIAFGVEELRSSTITVLACCNKVDLLDHYFGLLDTLRAGLDIEEIRLRGEPKPWSREQRRLHERYAKPIVVRTLHPRDLAHSPMLPAAQNDEQKVRDYFRSRRRGPGDQGRPRPERYTIVFKYVNTSKTKVRFCETGGVGGGKVSGDALTNYVNELTEYGILPVAGQGIPKFAHDILWRNFPKDNELRVLLNDLIPT